MDANADNIAGLNLFQVRSLEGFIHQGGVAKAGRGCCREYIQPSRRNHCSAERDFAGIDKTERACYVVPLGTINRLMENRRTFIP